MKRVKRVSRVRKLVSFTKLEVVLVIAWPDDDWWGSLERHVVQNRSGRRDERSRVLDKPTYSSTHKSTKLSSTTTPVFEDDIDCCGDATRIPATSCRFKTLYGFPRTPNNYTAIICYRSRDHTHRSRTRTRRVLKEASPYLRQMSHTSTTGHSSVISKATRLICADLERSDRDLSDETLYRFLSFLVHRAMDA